MGTEDGVTGLAALVPEVYFDLISRVPPGFLVLAVFVIQITNWEQQKLLSTASANWGTAIGLISLLLGASYVVGLLLTSIGAQLSRPIARIVNKKCYADNVEFIEDFCEENRLGSITKEDIDFWDFYKFARGYLNANQPHTRNILAKMHAEYALCNNMIAAILVTIVGLIPFQWLTAGVVEFCLLTTFLIPLLVLSIFAAWHRYKRAVDRHIICLRQLHN